MRTEPETPAARAARTLALVEARVASVGAHLEALLRAPPRLPEVTAGSRVLVTGTGASSGPARYLASLLATRGPGARFVPLSSFAPGSPPPDSDVLIVFSQHLSPNARLALAARRAYRACLLVTSATEDVPGVHAVRLPPEDERGTLLRVVGPAVALLAAALFAEALGVGLDFAPLARLPELAAASRSRAAELAPAFAGRDAPVAVVTAGDHAAAYRAVTWKLLEGWRIAEPFAWDVMEIVHGPFQQFAEHPLTVLSLEAAHAGEPDLFDRLDRVLVPERHRHVRVPSSLPRHLAILEHDAITTELLVRGLRERPRDLLVPDAPADAPLYGMGA